MPSPLAHSTIGYVISRFANRNQASQRNNKSNLFPYILAISILASLLPDIDAMIGLLANDIGRFHNNGTHSLIVGIGVAALAGLVARALGRNDSLFWFGLILANYEFHILMDGFTNETRGVMLFWPLSYDRFAAPIKLFYGLRWSEGWLAFEHLTTLITELAFVVPVVLLTTWIERRLSRTRD
jgi:hypothetical protein